MGSDPRSSAAPLHGFRSVPQNVFSSVPSPSAVPPSTQTYWKKCRFGGLGPLSEFSFFCVFSVFPFFLLFFPFFLFFRFSGVLNFRIFRFLCGRVSGETVPQHSVCFPTPCPLPTPKPLTQNSQTHSVNATMQVNCCCWLSPSFPSMPTQVCCVLARRPQDAAATGRRR